MFMTKKSREQKRESWFVRSYRTVLLFLALLFIVFLLFLAMISTSVISPDFNEHTYFTKSSVIWNVVILIIAFLIVKIAWKSRKVIRIKEKINEDDRLTKRILMVLMLILASVLAWWVLMLDCQPKADQQTVMETVKHMRFGDFIDFEKGGYVSMNHQQFGIVIMEYLLSYLFGTENYLALQLLNIPGVILCYVMMERILKETGQSNAVRLAVVLICMLFFPFSMYVIFVYGTVWGMALALTAIYLEIRFFHTYEWKKLILCGFCMILAVLIKSNYEIFLIAMVLTALLETIREKKMKILILPFLLLCLLAGEYSLSEACIQRFAGDGYAPPMSTWTWIAMGTSENNIMADGWYSDAIGSDIYKVSYGDAEMDAAMTKNIVIENLNRYQSNPDLFLKFILKKTASQWNNPTFQGFWIVQRAPHVETELTQNPFVKCMYQYLKAVQILILSGVVLYLLLHQKQKPEDLLFLLTFAGGFVFHLFWEAKCQYALVYFILLIPYCVQGYRDLLKIQNRKTALEIEIERLVPVLLVLTIMICGFPHDLQDVKVLQKDEWPELKDEQDPWGFTS